MTVAVIIQARMGSTRLPGKVMKRLADHTVLGHVITRCQEMPLVDHIIVATTVSEEDTAICIEAKKYGVTCYRGSEENVLSRYYEAAAMVEADIIVRITSDCPLLDPEISNSVIEYFMSSDYDYVSSGLSQTFPRGLDTEVFSFKALKTAYNNAQEAFEKEHVTPYIYLHPQIFKVSSFSNATDQSRYRLTLDTEQDWDLIFKVYQQLYKGKSFGINAVLKLFEQYPSLSLINKDVQQKKLGE
ncbi:MULTISPECIES: cytidylyltransferase domain-containing protein [Saccharibacillus]|uniref:cytidylyltransferase domain-containing protein n=1 Tax=Saccharibacillus TaxID=456492 RepID=UPI00123B6A99|nr:glycosyltransferase family protein [Saccharibacillus sp. WB 17]MWJ33320.1 acylneuraminate cytidylyltransferase [Saccharibacillus sp. WB 17]